MDYTLQDALQAFEAEAWTASKRTITTQALISLKELVQRWTGATEQEIITEERTGRLVAFYKEKTIINPETLVREHWLSPGRLPTFMDFGEEHLDSSSDCLFLKNNVLEIEKERPDFLYMRDDDENGGNDCIDSSQCASVKKQCFGEESTEKQKTFLETEPQRTSLSTAPPSKRTEAANEARQEKSLAAWKDAFPCMVRVYASMGHGRQYTKKEVAAPLEAEGVDGRVNKEGKPTGAMFGYFWQVFTNSGWPIDDLSNCRWSPDVSTATTTDHLPDDS